MSSKGVGWAIEQKTRRAVDKLVLILMGEAHKVETGLAFPSLKWLVEHTGLDRKTVVGCMDRLEEDGLIIDTKERVGKTNQIKCFALKGSIYPTTEVKSSTYLRKGATCGTRNKERNNTSEAKASSVTRATQIDENFVPVLTEDAQKIASRHSPEWLERQRKRFVSYYMAHGKPMKNWNYAFRNWLDNAETKYGDNDERSDDNRPYGDNEFANLAARKFGGNGSARPSGSGSLL